MKEGNNYHQKFKHIHPVGATFFITFRLNGSNPKSTLIPIKDKFESKILGLKPIVSIKEKNARMLELRKQYFAEIDMLMDTIKSGPQFLLKPEVLEILKNELHKHDGSLYNLICYSVMSNHVHILIDTNINSEDDLGEQNLQTSYTPLFDIMKSIKGASARYINQALNRSGNLWAKESYDMYIRNEKMLNNVIAYILNNPVKAGIVDHWEKYAGNYYVGD